MRSGMIGIRLLRRLQALVVLILATAFIGVPIISMADAQDHCADDVSICTLAAGAGSAGDDGADPDEDSGLISGHCSGCHLGVYPIPEIARLNAVNVAARHAAPASQALLASSRGEQFRPPRL